MHGLGDTGEGWLDFVELLRPITPNVKYVLPTAPAIPVTINSGLSMPAWYDIQSLDDRSTDECVGIEKTHSKISQLIEYEIELGIPSTRIILGGFSQGAACGIYIGYTYPKPLAGVLALSGYLPNDKAFKEKFNSKNKKSELLMCHGEDDEVVIHDWGKRSFRKLIEYGITGNFNSYPYLGHSANEQELKDCARFIKRLLPPISKM
uniref:Phospholipase/carboxylesterase/thioesterase domain-containing protein n=1 Tax=Arcella intermedia TaxID=1963864 RepID=A0A6B2LIL7_9EUKA